MPFSGDAPGSQDQRNRWWLGSGPPPPARNWETFLFHETRGTHGLYSVPIDQPIPDHLMHHFNFHPAAAELADGNPVPQAQYQNPDDPDGDIVNDPYGDVSENEELNAAVAALPRAGPAFLPPPVQHAVPAYHNDAPQVVAPLQGQAAIAAALPAPPGPSYKLQVSIPLAGKLQKEIEIGSDLPPEDFLETVCLAMDIRKDTANLAWKLASERQCDLPRPFRTKEDVQGAIAKMVDTVKRARSRTPVLKIINQAEPAPPTTAASKKKAAASGSNDEEQGGAQGAKFLTNLRDLKRKVWCDKHQRYCYRETEDGTELEEHRPLNIGDVTFWAKQMAEGLAELTRPPNTPAFDSTTKYTPRRGKQSTSNAGESTTPTIVIHNHMTDRPSAALGDISNSPKKKRTREEALMDSDSDSDSDSDQRWPSIKVLLSELHHRLPDYNFPAYEDALRAKGIHYVDVVSEFPAKYYQDLGMQDGAVPPFLKHAAKLVRKTKAVRKASKAPRVN